VALESAVYSHGLPPGPARDLARNLTEAVEGAGATPRAAAKGNPGSARKIEPVVTTPASQQRAPGEGLGDSLRRARSDRGLSLADLEARTKIRAKYLAALEDERFEDLPPLPFARGFLHALARELDLDIDPLARRLEDAMARTAAPSIQSWRRLDGAVVPAIQPSRLRRLAGTVVVVTLVVGGALTVYFAQQLRRLSEPATLPVPPEVSTPVAAPAAAPPVEPTPGVVPPAPQPRDPRASGPPDAGVTVEVIASGRSWIRVAADDQGVFEGFMSAGEVRRWEARATITMRVGNAGAISVHANGRALGTLGRPGEVVDRTFSRGDTH
jgi:cytoskeletal protein RodZ